MSGKTKYKNPDDMPHGLSRYVNLRCRCDICRTASKEYAYFKRHGMSKEEFYRGAAERRDPNSPKFAYHGTESGYTFKCRCEKCLAATRIGYHKRRTARPDVYRHNSNTQSAKRRAIRKSLRVHADSADLHVIYENCPTGYAVDHIVPLSKGGPHTPDNLQYLPVYWNASKNNRQNTEAEKYAVPWQFLINSVTTIPSGSRAQESSKRTTSPLWR